MHAHALLLVALASEIDPRALAIDHDRYLCDPMQDSFLNLDLQIVSV